MYRIMPYIFIIFSQILLLTGAYAWNLPVEVSTTSVDNVKANNKLVIGIEPGASDGFDNLWDAPAMLSHPDPDSGMILRAYITGDDSRKLWKDIRGTKSNNEIIWDITVDPMPSGRSVLISWDIRDGLLKSGERLTLKDHGIIDTNGEPKGIDMSGAKEYAYISSGNDARYLSLVLTKEVISSPSSGSGSGFGCGTIRPYSDSSSGKGSILSALVILLSPVVFLRLLRLTQTK